VGVDGVHTSCDPHRPPANDLVGHGVGESLHRPGRRDDVAVQVQQAVEVAQREITVGAQQDETDRPQGAPREGLGIGVDRDERQLVDVGGLSPMDPLDGGPPLVHDGLQVHGEASPVGEEREDLGVEPVDGDGQLQRPSAHRGAQAAEVPPQCVEVAGTMGPLLHRILLTGWGWPSPAGRDHNGGPIGRTAARTRLQVGGCAPV
jgi:hypothetical protein